MLDMFTHTRTRTHTCYGSFSQIARARKLFAYHNQFKRRPDLERLGYPVPQDQGHTIYDNSHGGAAEQEWRLADEL